MNEKIFSGVFECATYIMACKHDSEFYGGCKVDGLKINGCKQYISIISISINFATPEPPLWSSKLKTNWIDGLPYRMATYQCRIPLVLPPKISCYTLLKRSSFGVFWQNGLLFISRAWEDTFEQGCCLKSGDFKCEIYTYCILLPLGYLPLTQYNNTSFQLL